MMEGVFEGFIGAVIGIIVSLLWYSGLITRVEAFVNIANLVSSGYLALLSFILVLIGILIGSAGSALALRRYIEV